MTDKIITVRLEIKKDKIEEDLTQIIRSVDGFAIMQEGDGSPCDLFILEITGEDIASDFKYIHSILATGAAKHVFLTSAVVDPEILVKAIREGAKEFYYQPIRKDEVRESLHKFREMMLQADPMNEGKKRKHGRIISAFGSKGGVGTTTITTNIAVDLAESNPDKTVALIDMNMLFGEIPLLLDLEPAFNWAEVIKNIARLDATYLMSIMAKHPSGLYVLPSPSTFEGSNMATPQVIEKVLRLMQTEFDYIVIDGGQSMNAVSFEILKESHTVLIVAVLSLPCLVNVKRLFGSFQRLGYPYQDNIKVIVNRYHKKADITLEEAHESIRKDIFWTLPNDYLTTTSAVNQGKPLATYAPKSEICKSIQGLSKSLIEQHQAAEKSTAKEKERIPFLRSFFSF